MKLFLLLQVGDAPVEAYLQVHPSELDVVASDAMFFMLENDLSPSLTEGSERAPPFRRYFLDRSDTAPERLFYWRDVLEPPSGLLETDRGEDILDLRSKGFPSLRDDARGARLITRGGSDETGWAADIPSSISERYRVARDGGSGRTPGPGGPSSHPIERPAFTILRDSRRHR